MPDIGESGGFSYRVDYRPAYALATVALADGQSIKTEAGAMVSMSANLELVSKMEGGLWSAVKRSVGGRSAFVSTYTARGGPGMLCLAPGAPGDIVALRLTNERFNIAASSWLASDPALEVETDWGGAKSFFASNSMFVLQVQGSGVQFVTSFGTLHQVQLAAGEKYVVDTGHLIAWHANMPYEIRKATRSFFRSLTSGEVLVAEFTGPGTLLLQTRNLRAFADTLIPFLPEKTSGADVA